MNSIISIEPHNCSECYRCIRVCRTKAIEVVDNQAAICSDECTNCGECLSVCPHDMITLREDKEYVKRLLKRSDKVVVSLHWSWNSEFTGIESYRVVEALRLLGFAHVSEALHGSEMYEGIIAEKLHKEQRPILSIECPVMVRLAQNRNKNIVEHLPQVAHPALLHSRMLKSWYGDDIKVVHITPCVAMKPEENGSGEIDAVLTFKELREWMWEDGVEFDFIEGKEHFRFEPFESSYKRGAAIKEFNQNISLSGFNRITRVMQRTEELRGAMFIELWNCSGGCLEGIGSTTTVPLVSKEFSQQEDCQKNVAEYSLPNIDTGMTYTANSENPESDIAESQIERALREVGKFRPADYHNCNACGYETCRDFAVAMVKGHAESSMCMSYSRNLAQKKFSALLDKMPSGVMLVDHNLKIIEANQNIADILGADAQLIYGANTGMKGADLEKLIDFTPLLSSCLAWNKDRTDEDVQIGGKMYRLSLFSIEPHRVICVVINHIGRGDAMTEEMANRTRAVIRENLDAVQKIAYLLGETASRTEAVLNSIIEQR